MARSKPTVAESFRTASPSRTAPPEAGDERSRMEGWKVQKKELKISFEAVAFLFFLFILACGLSSDFDRETSSTGLA